MDQFQLDFEDTPSGRISGEGGALSYSAQALLHKSKIYHRDGKPQREEIFLSVVKTGNKQVTPRPVRNCATEPSAHDKKLFPEVNEISRILG